MPNNLEMLDRQAQRLCANLERARRLHEELLHITENIADIAQTLLLMVEAEKSKDEKKG
jgi:hypothetical protein